jgi:hypothetical protein
MDAFLEDSRLYPQDIYTDVYKGFTLEARRKLDGMGHWCGYISHPSKEIMSAVYAQDVHGDWTYDDEKKVGFDCAHAGDFVPGLSKFRKSGETYWTLPMVWAELKRVCDAVAAATE